MLTNVVPGSIAPHGFHLPPWTEKIRVLAVIPAGRGVAYATRQVSSLLDVSVDVRTFFLLSRTSPPTLMKEYKRLRREIHQFRPHVLHAHFGTMTSFLCAAVSSAAPLVITFRGSDLNRDPEVSFLRSFLGRLLSQISCLRGKRIVCMTRQLRDRLWWGRSRAVVIPDGIDLNLFRPQPKDHARRLLRWKQGAPIVVFHGGNRPRLKGLHFVQAAVRFAEKDLGPIQLMNLDGSVPPELVPYYLNAADCLALASVTEGSPNIVKEALACNLPVVATDVGDVAERLNGIHPSRVVRREVSEFGSALTEVLLENRSSNGREHVENLALVHVAEAIRSVYEAVVQACAK
jgi:teichuronic acid biosynthesis glycosyltransferase TuaC